MDLLVLEHSDHIPINIIHWTRTHKRLQIHGSALERHLLIRQLPFRLLAIRSDGKLLALEAVVMQRSAVQLKIDLRFLVQWFHGALDNCCRVEVEVELFAGILEDEQLFEQRLGQVNGDLFDDFVFLLAVCVDGVRRCNCCRRHICSQILGGDSEFGRKKLEDGDLGLTINWVRTELVCTIRNFLIHFSNIIFKCKKHNK